MPRGESTWAIKGTAGSLRAGSREAAAFKDWDAGVLPDGRWRISATNTTADPYWLENGTSFRAVLTMGKGEVRGTAQIVSIEPLVFDMEIPQ
jgi:hypothetical protein